MHDPSILTRWQPQLRPSAQSAVHTSSSPAVACSGVTFLGFSGGLPASLAALHVGPVVLFRVYDLTLNTMKDAQEPGETTFYCSGVYCRDGCSQGDEWCPVAFWGYSQHLTSAQGLARKLWPWCSVSCREGALWLHAVSLYSYLHFLSTSVGATSGQEVCALSCDKFIMYVLWL